MSNINVTNNTGIISTGDNSMNTMISYDIVEEEIDWNRLQNELSILKTRSDLESVHNIADEASQLTKAKDYPKLMTCLRKLGEIGLNIAEKAALCVLPELIKNALGIQ